MAKSSKSARVKKRPQKKSVRPVESSRNYARVLAETTKLIAEAQKRALIAVNHELVCLYWHIGRTIVRQQESANWGDSVVRQFARDLRIAFPEMKGLTQDNLWRMRQFFLAMQEIDHWLQTDLRHECLCGLPCGHADLC